MLMSLNKVIFLLWRIDEHIRERLTSVSIVLVHEDRLSVVMLGEENKELERISPPARGGPAKPGGGARSAGWFRVT